MDTTTSPPTAAGEAARQHVSLFLRVDGTLLLVRGGREVEMSLTPRQLLELGADALHLAFKLNPGLLPEVAEVLAAPCIMVPAGRTQ
jgi:hypothetical protein